MGATQWGTGTTPGTPQPKPKSGSALQLIGVIIGLVILVWLIIFVIGWATNFESPQAGEIGVVRGGPSLLWVGDWGNGHTINGVIAPGSGTTNIGFGSSVHYYPADSVQRYYTITADPKRGDRPGVDVVQVQTKDGIEVGIEGTFYFTTGFNGSPQGEALAKDFDNRFGVRTFPIVGCSDPSSNSCQTYAYSGTDGWEAFLDTVIRPIIDNDLRTTVGQFTCAQLLPACALVYNQTVSAVQQHTGAGNSSLAKIQTAIQDRLQSDIAGTIGKDYFAGSGGIKFLVTGKPTLPGQIQDEINNAQAQFAKVGTSEAQLKQAQINTQANEVKQKGYSICPACAEQDIFKSIPSNVTTFAPGQNFSITSK